MQIAIGLPDPKEFSSMPRLKLVQSGIQHYTSQQHTNTVKIRLPITPTILQRILGYWLPKSEEPDIKMLWAAVVICFLASFAQERSLYQVSVPLTPPVTLLGVMCHLTMSWNQQR